MKIRNIICAVLCLIVAAALGYMYFTAMQQEKEQTAELESLLAEVQLYEADLSELEAELSSLQSDISYTSDEAEIIVSFVASDASDLSYIEEKAEIYQFSPVLVIDCAMELEIIKSIIEAADDEWEIMLYDSVFSESENDNVLSVIDYLQSVGKEYCRVFYLRLDYSSTENIQLLIDDGFIGYTSYHDENTQSGQTEDDFIYFEYSYLTTTGTVIANRLYSLYTGKASMIVTFDMASINSGELPETYVDSLFETMQIYTEYDDCSFSTVADVIDELSQINSIEEENQAVYEERIAEIEARINELQKIISELYERAK